ncbi:MAG: hypothetical protein E7D52_07085 [Peptoniphilus harei]|uniref:hypothetical protein n=1 Tax=Peptoniphilus harei TaxID=54005 RepID=UPI0029005638|nr:hypothetical protein [Peptoniphilus harei]MDU2374299.1 hypothetical protein [Peptoniphilus harei]MDU2402366.1 hypothetical protein [Bifidobacterium longum]
MARGRKSEQIKRITRSDGETLKSIAHTGLITRSNAKEYFNLNEKRIELLKKNNYLIEHTSNTKQGLQTYYTLGSAGANFIKSKTDIDYLYRGNKNQIDHDIKLNQAYCQITHEQRQGWINENQIIHKWGTLSPDTKHVTGVDAIVTTPDGIVAIEVITRNYGEIELQEKQDAANALGCSRMVMINA